MNQLLLRDLIGKPYKVHGRGPDAYDCYGLAIEVCRRFGKSLPDTLCQFNGKTEDQSQLLSLMAPIVNAVKVFRPNPGDVVVLVVGGKVSHIGVCLGDGTFIHATEKLGVRTSLLSVWSKRIEGYYTWQ